MADDHHHGSLIIIKKKSGGGHGHHGGAWKIAFADFMTAMMAFFLVLWIINATDKSTKTIIARYFNPVKLENPAKSKKGLHGETSAPTEGKEKDSDKASGKPAKDKEAKGTPPPAETKEENEKKKANEEHTTPTEAAAKAEAQMFAQPYQALDKIAAGASDASPGASPDKGDADPQRLSGALSIDSFRDPFKPIGPGSPDDPAAFDADARNQAPPDLEPQKSGEEAKPEKDQGKGPAKPHEKPAAPKDGAVAALSPPPGAPEAPGPGADAAKDLGKESAKLESELKQKVQAALKNGAGPEIEARQTKDGLLISLTDKLDFAMFNLGSAVPRAELVRAMEAVAKIVKQTPGHIVVRGYTDARPYRNGAYDNWRLSSDRAQMAYYMLTRGGAPASRFTRVEGYADRALKDPAHPLAAVNRRLEILVEPPK